MASLPLPDILGTLLPGFAGTESILLATGIVGATVMPHVIYLHSALTQNRIVGRNHDERRRILRFEKIDVVIALAIAGAVNLSMMIVAAALFHGGGLTGIETIEGAYTGLQTLSSQGAATIFGIALLGRCVSIAVDGTYPGVFPPMLVEAAAVILSLAGSRVLPHRTV